MPLITQFSRRAMEAARRFFEEHPVFEMEQLREVTMEGPGGELVRVLKCRCLACGFELAPDGNPMFGGKEAIWPADALKAIKMTHAWDQASRSKYCGGHVVFETAPVREPVEIA